MNNFKRVAFELDVEPLLASIAEKDWMWHEFRARQETPGSPHADTQTIVLRGPRSFDLESIFNDLYAEDTKAYGNLIEARQLVKELADCVNARAIGRLMLVSLKPGGFITPHVDEGRYADYYERFHIVLASNPECWFQCNYNDDSAEFVRMKRGEAWWFNHKRQHTFMNNGETPRIHLIADMVAPSYRRERDAV